MPTTTLAPITFTVHGQYLERGVIPPRCRKPRDMFHETSADVTIPHVSGGDAPLAFQYTDDRDKAVAVREHNGVLYAPQYTRDGGALTSATFTAMQSRGDIRGCRTQEEFADKAQQSFDRFLFIDDTLWERTGEPRYAVVTTWNAAYVSTIGSDDASVKGTYFFRADQTEEALAFARSLWAPGTAPEKDSTLLWGSRIEVIRPEAVTLVIPTPETKEVQELRSEYQRLLRMLTANESSEDEKGVKMAEAAADDLVEVIRRLRAEGAPLAERQFRPYERR